MAANEHECWACKDDGPLLTGIDKARIEQNVRIDPVLDGPAHDMAADLTPDGEVKFRPATLADQLDRLIAEWLWSQAEDAVGEVGE